jgi:hypothetical protein
MGFLNHVRRIADGLSLEERQASPRPDPVTDPEQQTQTEQEKHQSAFPPEGKHTIDVAEFGGDFFMLLVQRTLKPGQLTLDFGALSGDLPSQPGVLTPERTMADTAQGAEVQGKLAGLQGSLNQKHEEVTTKLGDINSMLPLWWERALMFFLLSLSLLLGIGHWIWPRRRLTLFERQTIRDTSHMVQETHTLIHELRELIIQPSSSSSNHSPDPRPVLAIILERITGRSDGFQGFDPSTFRPTSFLSDGRILGTVGNPRQHLQWAFALQNADKQIILLGEYPRIMDEKKGVAYQGSPGRPEWIISPMNDWEKHAAAVDSVATTPAAPPN